MQVATSITRKIMLDAFGLQYICATADRFFEAATALAAMVNALAEQPSARLLKHVVRCYLRLTDNPRYALIIICVPGTYRNDGVHLDHRHLTHCCPQGP